MATILPADLAARYDRDGFIIVSDLLSPEECDTLKAEARRLMLEKNAEEKNSVVMQMAATSPLFRALSEDARVVDVLRPIMPEGIMFLSDKLVFKSADKTFPTPNHVDAFYWPNTRPKLSVWIPLDDATAENGTLTVIPGSHKKKWQVAQVSDAKEFGNTISDADCAGEEVVTCAIARGTAIVFSDLLVHGSTANSSGKDRYAIISTYHAPEESFDRKFPARKVLVTV